MTKHTLYRCPPDCDRERCPYHEGGLAHCTVCGGAEGSLPSECPGSRMSEDLQDQVYNQERDFIDGEWRQGVRDA